MALAILMAGGLVLFGIGSNVSGGLSDALNGGGGDSQYKDAVDEASKAVAANPKSTEAYEELIASRYSLAGLSFNQEAQEFDEDGLKQMDLLLKDWLKYKKLVGDKPDLDTTNYAVNAYVSKQDAKGAQKLQMIVAEQQPNASNYLALMRFALSAGDSHVADASAVQARELAEPDQVKAVEREIKQLLKLAQQQNQAIQKQIQEQLAAQQNNQSSSGVGSPFGGLENSAPPASSGK
ncbi:MAG: hypothetical protein HZB14_00915 [Actinobacteria bacterium]|nr:hypothetical protein [Actinomycetota bacterium]